MSDQPQNDQPDSPQIDPKQAERAMQNSMKMAQEKARKQAAAAAKAKEWDIKPKTIFGGSGKLDAYGEKMLHADEDLPLMTHIQLFVIILSVIAFITWANFANLDQVTRGTGKVIPSSEVQKIQHQEGGIIDEFLKREGQQVAKGEVFIRLRDVGSSSDLGARQERYYGLQAKLARLEAEAAGKGAPVFSDQLMENAPSAVREELNAYNANKRAIDSQISVLQSQVRQRRGEVTEINGRIRDLQSVARLTEEELAMTRPGVASGAVPKRDLLQLEREAANQKTELNGLRNSLPRANSAIREAQNRINDLRVSAQMEAQAELAEIRTDVSEISQTLGALEDRQDRTEIISPVDGIVKDLMINTVGGVIRPGDFVAEIVPNNENLLVEVQIRPSDIAFISPGQEAMVKITAYDFSIYGGLKGNLVDISPDTVTNEDGESFYRVRVRTGESKLKRKGEILPIIPGMVASVDILTGEKTVMEYLLKPFIKTLDEAMNER